MNNKGVGLGLIICQQLCISHRGRIWLSSRESEGSTFSFTMQMPAVKQANKPFVEEDQINLHSSAEDGDDKFDGLDI